MTGAVLDPHHDGSEAYVPQGRKALGDVVPVRVRVPVGREVRSIHVRSLTDAEPSLAAVRFESEDAAGSWWVGQVTVANPVTRYRFLIEEPDTTRWLNAAGYHDREVPDAADFRLTVHAPAPDWARAAVVYQVFPDRFARSGATHEAPEWAVPTDWDIPPEGAGRDVGRQYYGGDLPGIEQHLDHLQTLGVDVLYLTPVFPGRSNHRYDAATFDHVDPLLGGDEALASLAAAVHTRGMRIMGDITTNHTGSGHEWFERARGDHDSEESGYYLWTDAAPGYVAWLGHASLPKLNHADAALRARMIEGPHSVVARWLAPPYSLDGWRVDVANMTGRHRDVDLTHEVARTVRATMTAARPDALLVSEHFHDASGDLDGDGWHANMNYMGFSRPVWAWLVPSTTPLRDHGLPFPRTRRAGPAVAATMREFAGHVPWQVTAVQWNMVSSHDTARIRTVVEDPRLVEVAAGIMFTYPGTPVVYAGDEIGAQGRNGESGRVTMPWERRDTWDHTTFEAYRRLIAVRHGSRALRDGGLRWVAAVDDALLYLRETGDERVLVAAARAPWSGLRVPEGLVEGIPLTLYGPDLRPVQGGYEVPGDGPGIGVWRIA